MSKDNKQPPLERERLDELDGFDDLDAVDAEELAQARAFASVMDALDAGRSGLDALPIVDDDAPLPELMQVTHLMRDAGGRGTLSDARKESLWEALDAAAQAQVDATPAAQPSAVMRWLRWALFGAPAVAGLLLLVWLPSGEQAQRAEQAVKAPPHAVAQLDARRAEVAQALNAASDPHGDTRLRDHRRARFDAWRADTTWQRRFGARSQP